MSNAPDEREEKAPRPWWRRLLRGLAVAVGGTLVLVVLVVLWALGTAGGRATVVSLALPYVDEIIAGSVEIDRVDRLGPSGLTAHGIRLLDPTGATVASVEDLEVDLTADELFDRHVQIDRVAIGGLWGDLRHLDEETRGLLAAVATEPSPPEPEGPPSAWVVDVEGIALRGGELAVESPPWGELVVADVAADAEVHVTTEVVAEVHALSFTVRQGDETLAAVDRLAATYRTDGQPSAADLHLTAGGTEVTLRARAVAPPAERWRDGPVEVTLQVAGVGPELFRALRVEAPPQLGHPLGLSATVTGTPVDLKGDITLRTPGGTVDLDVGLKDFDAADLTLRTEALEVAAIWSDVAIEPVTGRVRLETELKNAPTQLPFRLLVRDGKLGELELPKLDVEGRLDGERVRDVKLDAEGWGATLAVQGEAGFDGSAQATLKLQVPNVAGPLRLAGVEEAKGSVAVGAEVTLADGSIQASARADVRKLAIDALDLERATVDATASGPLEAPVVGLSVRTGRGSFDGKRLEPSRLQLRGGPERYRLVADVEAAGQRVALTADAALRKDGVTVSARGKGRVLGKPLVLDVRNADIGFDGRVGLGALRVEGLGQTLTARGELRGRRTEELVIESGSIDLGALSRGLGLDPSLDGDASVRVALRGTVERPIVHLTGGFEKLVLPVPPGRYGGTASGTWDVTLDTVTGSVGAEVAISTERRGKAGPTATLTLGGGFPTWGPWTQRILDGEDYEVRVAVAGGTVAFLQPWLPSDAPVTGTFGLTLAASGRPLQPKVHLGGEAHLQHPKTEAPLDVTLGGDLDAGHLDLSLRARDAAGPWIDLQAEATTDDEPLDALAARAATLGHDADWKVRLRAEERLLEKLPFAIDLPARAKPARVFAHVVAEHASGVEPVIEATVDVRYPPVATEEAGVPRVGMDRVASRCQPRKLFTRVRVGLEEGDVTSKLLVGSGQRLVLEGDGSARLPLSPLLAGRASVAPTDVDFGIDVSRIDLAQLPVVCGLAQGSFRGRVEGTDLLGAAPKATVTLALEEVGTHATLDGDLAITLDAEGTSVDVGLRAGDDDNEIHASLPLALSEGKATLDRKAPFDATVKLGGLPLAAVAPIDGPLSRISGEVTGQCKAGGTLDAPRVDGAISLHDIGLTLTAMAQPLRRIHGDILFDNDRIRIRDLVARDKEGKLTVNGEVTLDELPQRAGLDLDVTADDFPVRQSGQVAATVNLAAKIEASLGQTKTDANVTMTDVDVWLETPEARGIALTPHPDIVDPRREEKKDARASQPSKAKTVHLDLDMTQPFWIKRDDMAVRLSAELDARIEGDDVRVTGAAKIQRGYLQLLGMLFDIEKGSTITFVESNPPDPVVDLGAKFENRRSGQVVGVRITGRVSEPELAFLVDGGEVTPGEAIAAMFGEGSQQDGSNAEAQAKSMLAGVAAGMLALAARKELGAAAPIILIEPGDDAASSRVRVGFDLDDLVPDFMRSVIRGVYIEGVVAGDDGTGGGVSGGVLLDLFLPASLVLTGQYGPGQTWAVDFGWEP